MSQSDRAVHRASRYLADGEVILASAAGREADGRRRGAVLITDRRVLVAWHRATTPDEMPLDGTVADHAGVGSLLTISTGDREAVLREVDPVAAAQVVRLLVNRRPRPEAPYAERVPHVRILAER